MKRGLEAKVTAEIKKEQMLQDKLKEVECPGIYPGRDCCNDNPEVLPDE